MTHNRESTPTRHQVNDLAVLRCMMAAGRLLLLDDPETQQAIAVLSRKMFELQEKLS